MPTTVARLDCEEPTARRLADVLGESLDADNAVCGAFEDDDGQWQVAIHFRDAPDETAVRALIRLAAGEALANALRFETVAATDWVLRSLQALAPVHAGRFLVYGAHDRARVKPNDIAIEIEAALAFGTGHHGTTRGCLLALDDLAKRHRRPCKTVLRHTEVATAGGSRKMIGRRPARFASFAPQVYGSRQWAYRVLDIGTGSGVLAIAAAKIFRTRVVASDIDPVAVRAGRANAQRNRVAAFVMPLHAAGATARGITARAPYHVIFANILLTPILRLAVPLTRLSRPGTRLMLSGLLPAQANAVLATYRAQGFFLARRIVLDGWVTLVLRFPPRHPVREGKYRP